MKFVVIFVDDENADPNIRGAFMEQHLRFLEDQAHQVEAAGPLLDADGAAHGGLWLVEAEDEAAVDALVKADPFWPTGLRASYDIKAWRQVFASGRRQI